MTKSSGDAEHDPADEFNRSMNRIEFTQEYKRVYQKLVEACGAQPDLAPLASAFLHFAMLRGFGIRTTTEHLNLVRAMAEEYFEQVPRGERRDFASVSAELRRKRYSDLASQGDRLVDARKIGESVAKLLSSDQKSLFGAQASQATAMVKEYLLLSRGRFGTFAEYVATYLDFFGEVGVEQS